MSPNRRQVRKSASHTKANWRSALSRMEGAYSAATIRAYASDFAIFEAWCEDNDRACLPATPETVAAFLEAESTAKATATIPRRAAAIAKIHKLMRHPNPAGTEEVLLATRTVFRKKGRRQDQARGLTGDLKAKLIARCGRSLKGLRDKALIATGYDTLCRRAELVALRIEDLNVRPDGSGTILVRKSKTDRFGAGRLAYLSPETVSHLTRWLKAAKLEPNLKSAKRVSDTLRDNTIQRSPLFRRLHGSTVSDQPLTGAAVSTILKDRAIDARLPRVVIESLSGHSMRVGAAQDMAAAGIELVAIMHAGGWKSPEMVMRYIEHMDVQKSGMARLYETRAI